MKNNKGFTLIELLAIIVILAVIMVIAVPKVLDIVSGTKNSAWKNNVSMIERSITKNSKLVDPETGFYKYTIADLCSNTSKLSEIVKMEDTNVTCSGNTFTLTGTGQFEGKSATISCTNNKCSVNITDGVELVLDPGLYDGNNNLIASWDDLVNTYGLNMNYNPSAEEKLYTYVSSTLINSIFNLDNGNVSEEGWYSVGYNEGTHDKEYTKVDIMSVNSTQPAVIIGKLTYNKTGSQLVLPGSISTVGRFLGGTDVEKVIISNGTTEIGEHAFEACANLKSIVMADSVVEIGEEAFEGCTSLQNAVLSNNLKSIGLEAFCGCINLTSIKLPNSLNELFAMAFVYSGIKNITIPRSMKIISRLEFIGDDNLETVTFEDPSNWEMSKLDFGYSCSGGACNCEYEYDYTPVRGLTTNELNKSNNAKSLFITDMNTYYEIMEDEEAAKSEATCLNKTNIDLYEYGKEASGYNKQMETCSEED